MLDTLKWILTWFAGPSRIQIVELSEKLLTTANSASDLAKQSIAELSIVQSDLLAVRAEQFEMKREMAEIKEAEKQCKHELASLKEAMLARDGK